MKKILAIMLAAVCVFSFAACSKTATETETTTAAEAATTEASVSAEAAAAGIDVDAVNDIIANLDITVPDNFGSVKTLGNYKGIEVTSTEASVVTDEMAMDYIETYVLPNFTEEVDVIEDGDTANIDYVGKKDGVAFDGGTAEGYGLAIGSGSFIDGFESGLIGVKKGETVDLELTFPENYASADLAGQAVVFTVTVNSISRQQELTDDLAPFISDTCKTAADVIDMEKAALQKEADLAAQQELYYNAVEKLVETSEVEPSDEAITYTKNSYVRNDAAYAEQIYGMDFGTILMYTGYTSFDEYADSYTDYAVDSVSQRLVLREIAKLEKFEVNDEAKAEFAESVGYDVDTLKEIVDEKLLNELILENMANKFIAENAKVTYVKAEE